MSIIDKLKLTQYKNLAVMNEPSDYDLFLGHKTTLSNEHDAIFIFVETIDEMVNHTKQIISEQQLLEKGYLYFAYPKKGNKRYNTFIHRDDIFTVVGLKRETKKAKKVSSTSQRVADYEDRVKDVKTILTNYPNELAFFKELTPGYQRDWARFIYSAKQQKTRNKREIQMVDILSKGFKSVDLYRLNKNK